MEEDWTCLLNERMDRALQRLRKQNGEYCLALQKSSDLYQEIAELLYPQEDTVELEQLRAKLAAYSDQDFVIQATVQETFYKAGYKDWIKLLRLLDILPQLKLHS